MSEVAGLEAAGSQYDLSQWMLIWHDFRRHRIALVAGVVVIILYLVALSGEFVAPYDPHHRETYEPLVPPMGLHIRDAQGRLQLPFAYGIRQERNPRTFRPVYVAETDRRYPMRLFIHGDSYKLFGIFKSTLHLFGAAGDQRVYLLGSDSQGRDLLSRIIIGTRISMTIGLVGVTISFILAIILGGVSGYFGGVADLVIQRFIEILTSLPSLPLWMALAAAIPLNWPITRVFFVITLVLSLMGWPILSRELRGKFLALRREDFVISAQLDNATTARLMLRYLVPSALSHIIASGTLAIPNMIIGETTLSFLGVGLRAPAISWGVLLQNAINIQSVVMSPWLLFPGLFVIIAVLAFNFLGDGLRDAADPYKS